MAFRSILYNLPLIVGFLFGFTEMATAQHRISTQRLKGQKGRFTSPELDQLFGVTNKTYSYHNLKQQDLKGFDIQFIQLHSEKQNDEWKLLLLLDESHSWKDSIIINPHEDIAFFATLEGNRNAICIGEFNPEEQQFYIERLYELANLQFNPVSDQTRITYCPYIYDEQLSAKEIKQLSYGFKYSTLYPRTSLFPESEHLNGTEGFWRLNCGSSQTLLDIGTNGDCFISFDQQTYIDCELIPDLTDSTVFWMAFRTFYLPVPEVRNDYENSLAVITETIDRVQAIGKISILSENRLWLEWYGLFDTHISEYRFTLTDFVFYSENNRERPIVVKRCQ